MDTIIGIVTSDSYHYIDVYGKYIVCFNIQVNRTVYIHGEIFVEYYCKIKCSFKSGDHIKTKGILQYRKGPILKTREVKKSSPYVYREDISSL